MYIDVHCHLYDAAYTDTDAVVACARAAGVNMLLCAGCDLQTSYAARELAERYPEVYFCCGFQPQEAGKYREGDVERLRALARHKKCLAVGEIGLDYHYEQNPSPAWQKEILVKQLVLAQEEGLPVVLHSRDCAEDMLRLLTEHKDLLTFGGDMHCYSHSAQMCEAFASLGLYFSFGGTATYHGSKKVRKSVAAVPSDRLLTETDSPYLSPAERRGERNEPANIPTIARVLAEIRGWTEGELADRVQSNAKRLFPKWTK